MSTKGKLKLRMSFIKQFLTKKNVFLFLTLLLLIVTRAFFSVYPVVLIQKIVDLANSNQFTTSKLLFEGGVYLIFQVTGIVLTCVKMYIEKSMQASFSYQSQIYLFEKLSKTRVDCIKELNNSDVCSTLIQDSEYIGNNLITFYSEVLSSVIMFCVGFFSWQKSILDLPLLCYH